MSRHLFLGTRFAASLAGYWLMDDELVDTQRFIDTIRDCDGIERSAHSKTHSKLQIHLTMKHIPNIAAGLLGLAFVIFGANHFLHFLEVPKPPEGSPPYLFFGAIGPTGFLSFVKVCEIIGGILVALPKTRNLGLLVIGPIVVNILAFQVFLTKSAGLFDPPVIAVTVLSAYLLWVGRKKFLGLINN